MKKTTLLALLLFILSIVPVKADEGMWLLPLLEKLNGKKMAEMGFTITPEEIYSLNNTSLKDAIVIFGGGCTGEIVSNSGLLFTNHHCGYGAIQKLSSLENDYLKDGFWAMNTKEELPSKGLSVTFLENFVDVTKLVEKATRKVNTTEERDSIIWKVVAKELDAKYVGDNKFLEGQVQSFYGGNAYYYIVYKTYTDIRFVGAPPSSIGKFGADTDNWMWPRHTGDFSVFRVYSDKDNNPAEYSADNVPYTPKQFLKISLAGIKKNDPTMILGYPGRTNRFMTRSELVETRDLSNEIRINIRGIRQDKMMEDMEADPKVRIQYSSKHSGSSNGWKKWIGMNETFQKLAVEDRRAEDEVKFEKWVNEKKSRQEKYGKALEKINTAITNREDALTKMTYLSESVARIELSGIANRVTPMIEKLAKEQDSDKKKAIVKRISTTLESFYKDYSCPTDRKIAKAMIKVYQDGIAAEFRPDFFETIETDFGGDINKYVDFIFDNSIFTSPEKVNLAIESLVGKDSSCIKKDPAYILAKSYMALMPELSKTLRADSKMFTEGKKEYIGGTLEMRKGEAIYPDANFSMRFTYGTVLPYSPGDAIEFDYITTLDGVMEKEDPGNWEFEVPTKLKELWKNEDFGQYAMENGKMPLAFLSNNDITGGNSGSPILNGAGELLGLAFDGNWESMSSDIVFEPELQRCINVDIRYVLFIIDKFGGAGYLLDEMVIVK